MTKNRVYEQEEGWYMHGHPGHTIFVPKNGGWSFNGNLIEPTFSPSVLEGGSTKYDPDNQSHGHHFFVTDGIVHYLGDRPSGCSGCAGRTEYYAIPAWDSD